MEMVAIGMCTSTPTRAAAAKEVASGISTVMAATSQAIKVATSLPECLGGLFTSPVAKRIRRIRRCPPRIRRNSHDRKHLDPLAMYCVQNKPREGFIIRNLVKSFAGMIKHWRGYTRGLLCFGKPWSKERLA